jgi:hypothetical protein
VSKDIRKYGDGRVKANLDIELVVDMMRMAEKIDVAVVVSGDGDFAPAIAAVQQKGVRVEVVSFRGNTSSDLMDVADVFIDISSVAKVEKGARSGRRVASDGDLSMTAVPDKESGVNPRRRRGASEDGERPTRSRRRSPRPAEEVADQPAAAGAGSLVALPGERLSRGAEETVDPAGTEPGTDFGDDDQGEDASGRRRRRRRGGRGRGRGTRSGEEQPLSDDEVAVAEGTAEQPGDHPDEVPTLPQHSGFGSVWDSQIGVAPDRGRGPTVDTPQDEDLEDEPEVPEYLLAEKRQGGRQRGGRGRSGGRSGGYRSAIDRERYGTSSSSSFSRSGRGRGSSGQAPRASVHAMEPIEQTPGGDPWSEVPPEVQELLRAELARREGSGRTASSPDEAEAKPKRTSRKRTTKAAEEA